MPERKNENLDSAHRWLDTAATELDLDPALVRDLMRDLLDLTRDVAHGPSRPAAPVTAFLVGLSAGRAGGDPVPEVRERIARLTALLVGEEQA
ncbi:DUF6457 domain-containing protein [Corynebacterium suedekumii]|uniref:DUF6457 domain-containing protein n=1 Tax=Corynebacterium suedekumii TaxID=3049801 RepID=A0ABY8VT53_9CORY|nr:DUF6457 domain-containing protein [Corynebacterium suedekumii]WIM71329.1 DUF6457 domain-containing protein [Corynebacterium suedekumii]